jgi:hypothetical protein
MQEAAETLVKYVKYGLPEGVRILQSFVKYGLRKAAETLGVGL